VQLLLYEPLLSVPDYCKHSANLPHHAKMNIDTLATPQTFTISIGEGTNLEKSS